MAPSKAVLAEHILYEHFGAAVGLIGSIFLARGRLSYEILLRLAPKTLRQSTIQASILTLIQHNCMYHVTDDDDGLEYFELILDEVLQRRRIGHFLSIARESWGSRGQDVAMRVLAEGKTKLANLLEDCLAAPSSSSSQSYQQTVKAVYDMLESGALRPVILTDLIHVGDQDMQFMKRAIRAFPTAPQPKDLKDIKILMEKNRLDVDQKTPEWGRNPGVYQALCEDLEAVEQSRREENDEYGEPGGNTSPRSKVIIVKVLV